MFAVNQHPGVEQEADLSQLQDAISCASQTLLCLDEEGLVLSRIWCLYEIWKTLEQKDGSKLRILMIKLDEDLMNTLFQSFSVSQAKATVESDRVKILADIPYVTLKKQT